MDQPPPTEYCMFWIGHWSTCMQKGEWASWVQAAGSIIAIMFAGHIANMQTRHARRLAAADRLNQLESWTQLLDGAGQKTKKFKEKAAEPQPDLLWLSAFVGEMQAIHAAVQRLDFSKLETYEEVEPAVSGLGIVGVVIGHARDAMTRQMSNTWRGELVYAVGFLGDDLLNCSGTLRTIIDRKRASGSGAWWRWTKKVMASG